MTQLEIKKVFNLANDLDIEINIDPSTFFETFSGCYLNEFNNNEKKNITLQEAAKFMRVQCLQLNGQWDNKELNDLISAYNKKFNLLG